MMAVLQFLGKKLYTDGVLGNAKKEYFILSKKGSYAGGCASSDSRQ